MDAIAKHAKRPSGLRDIICDVLSFTDCKAASADPTSITPLSGVKALAGPRGDLTVVPGAGHCEASTWLPGGWGAWAQARLRAWQLI